MYALHCKYSVFNNDRRPVKVFQSVSFTALLIFRFACIRVKELYNVNNQKSLEWMPLHTVSTKHGLRTTDCGLGIKHGLGIKCGPRTILVNTELIGSSQGKIRSKDC